MKAKSTIVLIAGVCFWTGYAISGGGREAQWREPEKFLLFQC